MALPVFANATRNADPVFVNGITSSESLISISA